jgi:hypothetical protein
LRSMIKKFQKNLKIIVKRCERKHCQNRGVPDV